MKSSPISKIFHENKSLFTIIVVGLFLLELEIFALAAMTSGTQSVLQVLDNQGNVIHESSGNNLNEFNKQYFETVFGPLEQYTVRINKHEVPFPFRAWFVAAVCIPIGAIMLLGFVIKAYLSLVYGEKLTDNKDSSSPNYETGTETKLESTLTRISRMNIFNIGFLVFVGVISYWIIPNMITYLGHIGIDFFERFKWVYIGAVILLVCVILWIVYLRYLLAKKSIESQTEIQKHRLSLDYQSQSGLPLLLEEPSDEAQGIIDYNPEEESSSDL